MESEISLFSTKKSAEVSELTQFYEKALFTQKKTLEENQFSALTEMESKNVLREDFLKSQLNDLLIRVDAHGKGKKKRNETKMHEKKGNEKKRHEKKRN